MAERVRPGAGVVSAPVLSAIGRLLINPLQAVAVEWHAWAGTPAELAELVVAHITGTPLPEIISGLHCVDLQRELFLSRDTGLWRAQPDGEMRLIDYSPPDSIQHAVAFANRAPVQGMACRFCALPDSTLELITEDYGGVNHRRAFIHPRCRRASLIWASWARAGRTETQRKEPQQWWQILGLDTPNATDEKIEAAFKRAAAAAHPDRAGGSAELMQRINRAREEALGPRTQRGKVRANHG